MSNEILSKDILNLYDYVSLRDMVSDIFKLLKYLEMTNNEIVIPRITSSYQIRYEQFVPTNSSKVEEFILKNEIIETKDEEKRRELLSKVKTALRKLNELELQLFSLTFYKNKTDEEISDIVCYCKDKIREIKKGGYIKFLSSLGLDNQCFK